MVERSKHMALITRPILTNDQYYRNKIFQNTSCSDHYFQIFSFYKRLTYQTYNYVELDLEGYVFYKNGASHMTKLASMPIYHKPLKSSSKLIRNPMVLNLAGKNGGSRFKTFINDGPVLTLTCFATR